MQRYRSLLILAVAASVFLAACRDTSDQPRITKPELISVTHAAWLSRQLPPETLAYLRIPTLWDLLTEPKANALHPAQVSDAHRDQVQAIRQALHDNVLADLPDSIRPVVALLVDEARSPIEVAALASSDGSPLPNFLFGTTLRDRDQAQFGAWLAAQLEGQDHVRILTPIDDRGMATLLAGPMPVYVSYNATTSRIQLLSGMSASVDLLSAATQIAADGGLTTLPEFERGIDASGRGLALWLDLARITPLVMPLIPTEAAMLTSLGLDQAEFLWLGSASKDGHSQFLVHLQMPAVGLRTLLPRTASIGRIATAGPPRTVARLALPSLEEWRTGVDFALSLTREAAKLRQQLDAWLGEVETVLGFELSDVASAFGPEIVMVDDEAGLWAAYQVRDRAALDRMTLAISAATDTKIAQKQIGSLHVNQWDLPNLTALATDQEDTTANLLPAMMLKYLTRSKYHLFWVDQGDYLVMASVPQVLIDREAHPAKGDVATWLAEHGLAWSGVALGVVGETEQVSRRGYHAYLQILQVVADLTGAQYDPFALPTASQAGLAPGGRFGFKLVSTTDALAFSLDYEYSAVEALLGNSNALVAVAVVGILAAIAIPAYQDYTRRAQVSQAYYSSYNARYAIEEAYAADGAFPDAESAETLVYEDPDYNYFVSVEADTGVITIEIWVSGLAGTMVLSPRIGESDGLSWDCESDLATKVLPADCR